MYGMIHRAARQMVMDQFGPDVWASVADAAETSDEQFIGSTIYDDTTTFQLVNAIARATDLSTPAALEIFGEYWITFANSGGYRNIMKMAGSTLPEFLGNLDRMHASIQVSLTGAILPTFEMTSASASEIHLVYRSQRTGLEPFVKGLMQGLLRQFHTNGQVEIEPRNGADVGVGVIIRLR